MIKDYTTLVHLSLYMFLLSITKHPLVVGWILYGLMMVGHDMHHGSVFTRLWMNKLGGRLFMDCIFEPGSQWIDTHNKIHHINPNGPEDKMTIFSSSIFMEPFYGMYYVLWKPNVDATYRNDTFILPRIVSHACLFWFWCDANLLIYSCMMYFLFFWGSLLALSTHVRKEKVPDNATFEQRQLLNTVDIFPDSYIASFLFSGINAHAVHHLYPKSGRGHHAGLAKTIEVYYPNEYMKIDTMYDACMLLFFRRLP